MYQSQLAKKMGEGPARAVWDLAEMAKADLIELAAKYAPDARFTHGVAEGAYSEAEVREYHENCEYQQKHYGYSLNRPLDRIEMNNLVKTKQYVGGSLDMGAGHIHPLRYALGLARAAESLGVTIFEGSEVHNIVHGDPAKVQTGKGHVIAGHVILAGNGYMPHLEGKVSSKVMPINSFICATEPLGDKAAEVLAEDIAVADSKFVVNYYRMSEDKRFLFGGRESYGLGFPSDISTKLVERMTSLFPQLDGVGVDYVWGGTLGITMTRLPSVQRVAPNILSGAGFSGHGVALSGFTGRVMAEAIAGQVENFDAMAKLPVPSFPGGSAFRTPLLALAMTWYSLRDRIGL
jgi:gamma-glutamylputrescine oxidase